MKYFNLIALVRKYSAFVVLVSFLFFPQFSAHADTGRIGCYKYSCLLIFQTHAAWTQRVVIRGPGYYRVFTGRGEGVRHVATYVRRGIYTVTMTHYNRGWRHSRIRVYTSSIYANDSGGDYDFNDAIVFLQ